MNDRNKNVVFKNKISRLNHWCGFLFLIISIGTTGFALLNTQDHGILFHLNGKKYALAAPMRLPKGHLSQHGGITKASLDTLANCYYVTTNYVEIIRQNDAIRPDIGLAMGFEFDETNGDYPYTPAYSVLQLKNFKWGGVEFSANDSLNYTGVSNEISEDLFVEIDRFSNDTIYGRFSGILLAGSGATTTIDSGYFKIRLYRKY